MRPDWGHVLLAAGACAALTWGWDRSREADGREALLRGIESAVAEKRGDWPHGEAGGSAICDRLLDPHLEDFDPGFTRDAAFDLMAGTLRKLAGAPPFEHARDCGGELDRQMVRRYCEADPFRAGMLFYDRALASCPALP